MRVSRGLAVLVAVFGLPAAAFAGPVQVNVLLASQMVVPDPSPGTLHLPTAQPGNLVLDPGGEVLLGTARFDFQAHAQAADSYTAETPFSVFVKVTDGASGQTQTLRVDGIASDRWNYRDWDGQWTNPYHNLEIGDFLSNKAYTAHAVLGGNDYALRVERKDNGTSADFVLSVGPASGVPEPATLLLAGVALVPVGLRALRRGKR
jgi:hypothetical protein